MKPRIGVTLGDVAGIGPEVAIKAVTSPMVQERCLPVLIGELSVVSHYAEQLAPGWELKLGQDPSERPQGRHEIRLIDLRNIRHSNVRPGEVSKECGQASLEFIRTAVSLCLQKKLDAMVTGPIHKEAAQLAGIGAPGHTEFLASLCQTPEVRMLLVVNHLRAMHLTTHLSLRDALAAVKKNRIVDTIHHGVHALRQLQVKNARIAVAGVNPHAGEGGLFGAEEIGEIGPAVLEAQSLGLNVSGPIPPDTVFYRMSQGEFDLVIAMYHDQGHIPLKLIGFDQGVNITIGLPIIRTSVDHGTAFDIVGQMKASPESMVKAIELACIMAESSHSR
jgi:4-hydroxythreonine-4-phosphate dehydrogenase